MDGELAWVGVIMYLGRLVVDPAAGVRVSVTGHLTGLELSVQWMPPRNLSGSKMECPSTEGTGLKLLRR